MQKERIELAQTKAQATSRSTKQADDCVIYSKKKEGETGVLLLKLPE
jgi:hypothetical protein